jgi:hypothetical protein
VRADTTPSDCFVVMPISDPEGYDQGHFQHVFDDILTPACVAAGYKPVRADQVRETNLIHLDVLQRLLDSPMVLCDLSSRNPNVLFELGLRQAFDRPVVLVQETGTPKIFDIAPLRLTEYRRARIYHEVIEDQHKVTSALEATRRAYETGAGVNSIVRILSLTKPAALPEVDQASRDPALQLIRAELSELRNEIRRLVVTPADTVVAFDDALRFHVSLTEFAVKISGARDMLPAIDSDILRELHRLHANVIRDYERYGLGGHVPEPIRALPTYSQ